MIRPSISIRGKITSPIKLQGKTNASIIREYPQLENVEIQPTIQEQIIKSDMYGFDEVKVLGVTSKIDENIKPENIRAGVRILDTDGGYEGIDTSDATATAEDILHSKTAYINNEKITGTIQEYDGSYSGNTSSGNELKITDASYLFYNGARINILNELLKTLTNVTSMYYMFKDCENLTELDVSNFNTSNVTSMTAMFSGCSNLTKLDVSNFNTSNVTDMDSMFASCSKLTELDVSNFNTSNVTSMSSMFHSCDKLTELDVSNFNTSNVTSMTAMFYGCDKLTELDVSNFNTSNVTSMSSMFASCLGTLKELDLSNFDFSKVTSISNMFHNTYGLTSLKGFKNLGKAYTQKTNNNSSYRLTLSTLTRLTHESLMDIINNLYDLNLSYDVANGGTLYRQGLVLGSTNLAKLTAEEIAIAINKGWNVS